MTNDEFIDPRDHELARKRAVEISDKKRDLSFAEDERNSQKANRLWLDVFWKEFYAMVKK